MKLAAQRPAGSYLRVAPANRARPVSTQPLYRIRCLPRFIALVSTYFPKYSFCARWEPQQRHVLPLRQHGSMCHDRIASVWSVDGQIAAEAGTRVRRYKCDGSICLCCRPHPLLALLVVVDRSGEGALLMWTRGVGLSLRRVRPWHYCRSLQSQKKCTLQI